MDGKFYIKKFIRSDGETLSFDATELYLASDNTLLVRADPATTAVEFTEADGGEMIKQRGAIYTQPVKGLIIPRTTAYWTLCSQLSQFFKLNFTYKIVYIRIDGTMLAVNNAWISSGLQIVPVPHETYSEWDIQFSIGNVAWTDYAENSQGQQIYSNTVTLPLVSANAGGETWDTVGLKSDSNGEVWEAGAGGVQTIDIQSTQQVYPVWVVEGPCDNPIIVNNTTDTTAQFNGSIASGQTLTVNFEEGTAYLNSALATRYISGYLSLNPGENTVGFNSDGGTTQTCTISWNNIVN